MEKLIVNVPAFNLKAIQPDMFIRVKHIFDKNSTQTINGIITKVEPSRLQYITSKGATLNVHLSSVLSGESTINVGFGLEEEKEPTRMEKLLSDALIIKGLEYNTLDIRTNQYSEDMVGRTFDAVLVDSIKYIKAPKASIFNPNPFN